MKILYVVQAYGPDIARGAESHCRMMATRMAARGHDVSVLTSCASEYETWANVHPPGTSEIEGVTVHRLPVDAPRDVATFGPLSGRVLTGHKPVPLFLQQEWIDQQGPRLTELPVWLWDNAPDYDAVVFFTYLYYPTVRGLPVTSGRVPTILHPLAHDEAPFYLDVFDPVFTLPTGMAYSVEEDAELVRRRADPKCASAVIGIGAQLDTVGDANAFRARFELDDRPYVVCVGRVDAHKGSYDLYDYFSAYKERNERDLVLVFVGDGTARLTQRDDVVITGWVDAQTRDDALAGAVASVHPSYFESFSMALVEAWAQSCPALVNARCEVFAGQARRSGGGLAYDGFAEFEAALQILMEDSGAARRLGTNGRTYTESRYHWDSVMDRYEHFLQRVPVV